LQQVTQFNDQSPVMPSGASAPASQAKNLFVINLCAATSPLALTAPDHAGLKRFIFFMSRRREEGRERFRLHMGYFATQEEAEKLLDIVREIYPGAWAGLAPGQRLRAALPQVSPISSLPVTAPAATMPVATRPAAAAPVAAAVAQALSPAPESSSAQALGPSELALLPDAGRSSGRRADLPDSDQEAAARALSSVRAVIASLGDPSASAPTLHAIPELKPLPSVPSTEIDDAAALEVLEASRAASVSGQRALRGSAADATPRDEKSAFAVQLLWSVQPIDMTQIPQLAIFSAYTLYGTQGNRDGRRWYGVRLGFFTDAVSAKQVAQYVRSDFSTVSVVPVSPSERERAKVAVAQANPAPASASAPPAPSAPSAQTADPTLRFIEDSQRNRVPQLLATPARRGPPGKRAKLRSARALNGRAKAAPMTLEQTLEILGAGQLEIDDGRTGTINEAGEREQRLSPKKRPSRIGRLLDRLSERLGS
jgi:hypothetical protein